MNEFIYRNTIPFPSISQTYYIYTYIGACIISFRSDYTRFSFQAFSSLMREVHIIFQKPIHQAIFYHLASPHGHLKLVSASSAVSAMLSCMPNIKSLYIKDPCPFSFSLPSVPSQDILLQHLFSFWAHTHNGLADLVDQLAPFVEEVRKDQVCIYLYSST